METDDNRPRPLIPAIIGVATALLLAFVAGSIPPPPSMGEQMDKAVIGDAIQLSDGSARLAGSMRIVVAPPKEGKIVLLAPDLTRSTQDVTVVKKNMRGFTPMRLVQHETQCKFWVEQLAAAEAAKAKQ